MTVVSQVAAVLRVVSSASGGVRAVDIARGTGLARSTASRLLGQMAREGLLERRGPDARFHPGLLVFEAARLYGSNDGLLESIDRALSTLARRTGHTVGVSVRDGLDVMAVRLRTGSQPLRVVLPPGERSPLIATSTGRAILSRMEDDAVRALLDPFPEPPTVRAPQSLDALMQRIARIRLRGFEEAMDEVHDGLAAVAAPLADPATGRIYALFAAFSGLHVTGAARENIAAELLAEARRMEQPSAGARLGAAS